MVTSQSGSTMMLPAKLFLVACLIAIAVGNTVANSTHTGRKSPHHVTRHLSHHMKHIKSTAASSTKNHENPPLDGLAHDPSHPPLDGVVPVQGSTETPTPETSTGQPQQQAVTSSTPSLVTSPDIPPQEDSTPPLAKNKTDPIVTSKQTESENQILDTATVSYGQESIRSTTESPITQVVVPQVDEVTQPFTHSTTDTIDSSKKAVLDIASVATNEQRSGQHENVTSDASVVTAKTNPPQEDGKQHLTPQKKETQDNVHDKLLRESQLTTGLPVSGSDSLRQKEVTNITGIDRGQTTSSPASESDIPAQEPKAQPTVQGPSDSPKIESDILSEKTTKNYPTDIKQEQTTSSPTLKTDITTPGDVNLPLIPTGTPTAAFKNVTTERTPPEVQVEIPKMTPTSSLQNIQPNKSMEIGNEKIQESKEVTVGVHPSLEANRTQLNTSAPPKIDSEDPVSKSSHANTSDIYMAEGASEAETKLYVVKVKPPTSNQYRNHRANGNRQRARPREDAEESETMTEVRNLNPSEKNTRNVQNRRGGITQYRQQGNEEESESEEMKHVWENIQKRPNQNNMQLHPTRNNMQMKPTRNNRQRNPIQDNMKMQYIQNKLAMQAFRERANNGLQNTPTLGLGRNPKQNRINGRVRPTERQFMDGEKIPVQGNPRMATLEKKDNTDTNQMAPVTKRISGNTNVKARTNGEQFIGDERKPINEHVNVDTSENRGNTRRGNNFPRQRQSSITKQLEGQIAEEIFGSDKTRPVQVRPNKKTTSLEERGVNNRNRAFAGQGQTAGSGKHEGRISEKNVLADAAKPDEEKMKMASLEDRRNNRGERTLTGSRQRAGIKKPVAGRYGERISVNHAENPTQVDTRIASVEEEHGDNTRGRTFTVRRRNSGNNQSNGRIIDKEEVDETPNQKNTKSQSSVGHGNRRNDQQLSVRKPTPVNQRADQGSGETEQLDERRVNRRNNRTSVGRGQSSGSDHIKTRIVPVEFDAEEPETGSVKTAEIENRRGSRPSTGPRYAPGYNHGKGTNYQGHPLGIDGNTRGSVRRVDRKTQSNLRGDYIVEGGEEGRVHSRKKRRAACTGEECSPERKEKYFSSQELLKLNCARCFDEKECSARDVVACNAAGMNFIIEEDEKFERIFNIVNIYGSVTLCVLLGLLVYVYVYQRTRKESNTFLCAGLIILSMCYIMAILAFVNAQMWI